MDTWGFRDNSGYICTHFMNVLVFIYGYFDFVSLFYVCTTLYVILMYDYCQRKRRKEKDSLIANT